MPVAEEAFEYAAYVHHRAVVLKRPPTREELSLLLYLFSEWGWREKARPRKCP